MYKYSEYEKYMESLPWYYRYKPPHKYPIHHPKHEEVYEGQYEDEIPDIRVKKIEEIHAVTAVFLRKQAPILGAH